MTNPNRAKGGENTGATEMTEKYDVEFFKKEYNRRDPICDGGTCDVVGDCVMDPWKRDQPGLVEKEKRQRIIQELAEITIRANQEIAELFRDENNGQLPTEPPTFKLVLYRCPSHKKAGLFSDPFFLNSSKTDSNIVQDPQKPNKPL